MMLFLSLSLSVLTAAQQSKLDPTRTLLVGGWHNSSREIARAVQAVGNVGEQDRSGMYEIRLYPGISEGSAEAQLRQVKEVRFEMPYTCRYPSWGDLQKANAHLDYLEAGDALHSKPGQEAHSEATDHYEYFVYGLQRRVGPNGFIDQEAISSAIAQRDRLSPARPLPGAPTSATTWQFIGPKNLSTHQRIYNGIPPLAGRVNCVAYNFQNPSVIYAGSAGGGVWKSVDAGVTWTPLSSGWKGEAVSSIAVDPKNGNNVYVGTGDFYGEPGQGFGVMISKDGGATWTNTGASDFGQFSISRILVDPWDSNQITLAAGHDVTLLHGGLWHSADGGKTWTKGNVADTAYTDIAIYIPWYAAGVGDDTYWAVGDSASGGHLYTGFMAPSGPATWDANTPPTTDPATDQSIATETQYETSYQSQYAYILQPYGSNHQIWVQSGGQWVSYYKGTGISGFPDGIASEPMFNWSQGDFDHFLATSVAVNQRNPTSRDALWVGLITVAEGDNLFTGSWDWSDPAQCFTALAYIHSDQHAMSINPLNANEMLVGNDGGVYRIDVDWNTPDIKFGNLNKTLGVTQLWSIMPHPTDPTQIIAGAQDNGTPISRGDLENWDSADAGDGGWSAYDLVHSLLYTTSTDQTIRQQALAGGAPKNLFVVIKPCAAIPPVVLTDDSNYLLTANNTLFIYNHTKNSWSQVPINLTTGTSQGTGNYVTTIAKEAGDANSVYTGAMDGTVCRVYDFTGTSAGVRRLDNPPTYALPKHPVLSLAANPDDDWDLLAGLGSSGTHHLYRCLDTGSSTIQWTDVSGNLPDTPVNAVVFDPFRPSTTWYVGTDVGVFMTTNSGSSWTNMTAPDGLPNAQVLDLKFGAGFLYAGTFGRGIWRIPTYAPTSLAQISVEPASVIGGKGSSGTVTVSNASGGPGFSVELSSSDSDVALPAAIYFGATETQSTFLIDTKPVASVTAVTIAATLNGAKKTTILTVDPPILSSITAPQRITGGRPFSGTVTLESMAPPSGLLVSLSSSSAVVKMPPAVEISNGVVADYTATTSSVGADTEVTLYAKFNGLERIATITLAAPNVVSLAINPTSTYGGLIAKATATLSVPAPASFALSATSSSTSVATVASAVAVPAGSTSVTFNVYTHGVLLQSQTTISVSDKDSSDKATITTKPAVLYSVETSALAIVGGNPFTCQVNLTGQAGPGGAEVAVSSSNPTVAPVPTPLKVQYNSSNASFIVSPKGVASATSITLGATYNGVTKTKSLYIVPAALLSLIPLSSTVVGGNGLTAAVSLNGFAPPAGAVVALKADSSFASLPKSVTISGNHASVTFTISTKAVTTNTIVHVSAVYRSLTKTGTITIMP